MTWIAPTNRLCATARLRQCPETIEHSNADSGLSSCGALRFSSAAHIDTVNVNLLIRLFRARRSPYGSRTSDDRGWTSRKAASRHHPVISVALLAGRSSILSSSRPTDTAKRYRSCLQPKALNDSL